MKKLILSSIITPSTKKLEYPVAMYKDISIELGGSKKPISILLGSASIEDYSFIFFRTWRKYEDIAAPIALFLKNRNIDFIDSEVGSARVASKINELMLCALFNIPIPHSLIGCVEKLKKMKKEVEKSFKYPVILKATNGKKGRDNFLVNSFSELKEKLTQYPQDQFFVIQEFIPNSYDYRFLVAGYKTVYVYKRIRNPKSGSHLNNVSKGGTREDVSLTSIRNLTKIANKISRILKREICGVDIVVDVETGKPYVLEANSAPQLNYAPALKAVREYLEERS